MNADKILELYNNLTEEQKHNVVKNLGATMNQCTHKFIPYMFPYTSATNGLKMICEKCCEIRYVY